MSNKPVIALRGDELVFCVGTHVAVRHPLGQILAGDEPDAVADDFDIPREVIWALCQVVQDIATPWWWQRNASWREPARVSGEDKP